MTARKAPGQRLRRNLDQPQWQALTVVSDIVSPTLVGLESMPDETREAALTWWREVWSSPVAAEFLAVDALALSRAARLAARAMLGEPLKAAELSELRHLEDRFGLNPQARRRLWWTTPEPPDSASADDEAKRAADAERKARRRRTLAPPDPAVNDPAGRREKENR